MKAMAGRESTMPIRRRLLLALPLAAAGCGGGGQEFNLLPPLVEGYRHLTPIRLNVAEIEIPDPPPGAVRVDEPVPIRPEREMMRMAQDRLVAMGTSGKARFLVQTAEFLRQPLSSGGLASMFAGQPGERLTCRLHARLEILSAEGSRVGFVEAQVMRQRTLPDGASNRQRAAEELIRQAMDGLNVEFEFQVRRALRAWLVEGNAPPAGAVEREELPKS
jgi:hypothetical protein